MSWPIGYAPAGDFVTDTDGTIRVAHSHAVAPRGWLEVPPTPGATSLAIFVRVRIAPDAAGHAFVYAEHVRVGDRRYPSLHHLALAEGAGWIAYLTRAIPAALVRASAAEPTAAVTEVSRRPSGGNAVPPALRAALQPPTEPPPPPDESARDEARDGHRRDDDDGGVSLAELGARAQTAARSVSGERRAPRRVLVVEDDVAVREGLRAALEAEGHDVIAVPHAGAALGYLTTAGARVDLVLLDMVTPVMNGWAFLEARRADPRLAAIPVVVVSSHVGDPSRGAAAPYAGVSAVLAKPVDPDAVLRIVDRCASAAAAV